MFTGIIEERGKVIKITSKGNSADISIEASKVLDDIKLGDSIAVNGICLTVISYESNYFEANISEETLRITTAKFFKRGMWVNLERALKLGDRLSGHIVTGHIDTIGKVKSFQTNKDFSVFHIEIENSDYMRYVVKKGSIAIDGISLTVNEITGNTIRLNIIPHTLRNTNLEFLKTGDLVNIEFDIIGKYIEKLIGTKSNSGITEEFLQKAGFVGGVLNG
jgi:riboflavin synthase